MKQLFSFVLVVVLLCSALTAFSEEDQEIYSLVDGLSDSELSELADYINTKLKKSTDDQSSVAETKLTAKEIMDALTASGFPIYNCVEYTEKTDLNELLGRPNQYTSKCNASEKRISASLLTARIALHALITSTR